MQHLALQQDLVGSAVLRYAIGPHPPVPKRRDARRRKWLQGHALARPRIRLHPRIVVAVQFQVPYRQSFPFVRRLRGVGLSQQRIVEGMAEGVRVLRWHVGASRPGDAPQRQRQRPDCIGDEVHTRIIRRNPEGILLVDVDACLRAVADTEHQRCTWIPRVDAGKIPEQRRLQNLRGDPPLEAIHKMVSPLPSE